MLFVDENNKIMFVWGKGYELLINTSIQIIDYLNSNKPDCFYFHSTLVMCVWYFYD